MAPNPAQDFISRLLRLAPLDVSAGFAVFLPVTVLLGAPLRIPLVALVLPGFLGRLV
jgi:hypothetical protein